MHAQDLPGRRSAEPRSLQHVASGEAGHGGGGGLVVAVGCVPGMVGCVPSMVGCVPGMVGCVHGGETRLREDGGCGQEECELTRTRF